MQFIIRQFRSLANIDEIVHGPFVEPKEIEKGTMGAIDSTDIKDINKCNLVSNPDKIDPSSKHLTHYVDKSEIFG